MQQNSTLTSAEEAVIDAQLVQRFLGGDQGAFDQIVAKYRRKMHSIALAYLHDPSDAEEIVQDTFIRAYRGLANFRGDSSLVTWLHRIATNLARNRYWYYQRRHKNDSLSLDFRIGENEEGTFADLIAADIPDPAVKGAREEFSQLVDQCMQKLKPHYREVLTMRNVLELPYHEIAHTLQLEQGTVKSRLNRARETLRQLLAEACPEFLSSTGNSDYFENRRPAYGCPAMA